MAVCGCNTIQPRQSKTDVKFTEEWARSQLLQQPFAKDWTSGKADIHIYCEESDPSYYQFWIYDVVFDDDNTNSCARLGHTATISRIKVTKEPKFLFWDPVEDTYNDEPKNNDCNIFW